MKCTPRPPREYLHIKKKKNYEIGPVIDPKMRNLQEIIGSLLKI